MDRNSAYRHNGFVIGFCGSGWAVAKTANSEPMFFGPQDECEAFADEESRWIHARLYGSPPAKPPLKYAQRLTAIDD